MLHGTPHGQRRAQVCGWTPHGSTQKRGRTRYTTYHCAPRYRPQDRLQRITLSPRAYYTSRGRGSQREQRGTQRHCNRCAPLFYITAETGGRTDGKKDIAERPRWRRSGDTKGAGGAEQTEAQTKSESACAFDRQEGNALTIDIKQLAQGSPLEMAEKLQAMIAETKDDAQGLDDAYFSQGMPCKVADWMKMTGGFHVLLIALQWVYDLADAITEELTRRRRAEALEEQKGAAESE